MGVPTCPRVDAGTFWSWFDLFLRVALLPFPWDMDNRTAMFAMDGIRIMPGEPTDLAFDMNLAGPHNGLRELHEERDADDHDHHREQASALANQGDVAEARRCQRGHGEIQGVVDRIDLRVPAGLQFVYERAGNEHEHHEVGSTGNQLATLGDPPLPAFQISYDAQSAQQTECAEQPQEREAARQGRNQQRHDDYHVEQ
jgi:hypothetical protein